MSQITNNRHRITQIQHPKKGENLSSFFCENCGHCGQIDFLKFNYLIIRRLFCPQLPKKGKKGCPHLSTIWQLWTLFLSLIVGFVHIEKIVDKKTEIVDKV